MKRKSLTRKAYDGRTEVYSDVSIFMTALVMKLWKLSLEEATWIMDCFVNPEN
ncbi:MAG: hypothetical protein ACUVWN_15290 [bacterium]